jgi:hypothetical protein
MILPATCLCVCTPEEEEVFFFFFSSVMKRKESVSLRRSPSTGHPSKLIARRESYILAHCYPRSSAFLYIPFVCRQCIRTSLVTFPVRLFFHCVYTDSFLLLLLLLLLLNVYKNSAAIGQLCMCTTERRDGAAYSRSCRMSHSCVCIRSVQIERDPTICLFVCEQSWRFH